MKKTNTRRALLMSCLSLLLCVSMLVGTTFAWFTDSVESGKNTIVAGNLDIELYYQVEGQSDWTKVSSTSNIFKENALWEPGYTEVVKLKVVNEGSLALKYRLGVNVASETGSVSVLGNEFKLSNYIKYGIVDGAKDFTRDQAIAAVDAKATALSSPSSNIGSLEAKDEFVVTMVVYMPTSVGNEANYATGEAVPTLNLGINLFATQYTSESDSFGSDYDKDAAYSVWDGKIPAEMPNSLVVDPATRTITVNDAAAFAYLNTLSAKWAEFYSNGLGEEYSNYAPVNGGKGTDYYYKWGWDLKLNCDIDLASLPWTPINFDSFDAVDGQGHIVKNINVNATAGDAGLFSIVSGNVSNIIIVNANIYAADHNCAGAVAGSIHGLINNVIVEDAAVTAAKYAGGIVGYGYASITNSSVSDSLVTVPANGTKEAGGLAGYLCKGNSGKGIVSGNVVRNTKIYAPTVASALASQVQVVDITFNTVDNVTVTTVDDTASIFVSNNVDGSSVVADNTEINCNVVKGKPVVGAFDKDTIIDAISNGNDVVISNDIVTEKNTETLIEVPAGAEMNINGNGSTITTNGTGTAAGSSNDYGYVGFIPANGEDATVSDVKVVGSGFVEVGHHITSTKGNYTINKLVIEDLIATLSITNGGNNIAAAFSHYGNATMTDCVMTGTTTLKDGYKPYDAAFVNGTKTNIVGGKYGNVYLANQAHVTVGNGAVIDTIDSYAITTKNLGKLVIGAGAKVGTINLYDTGKYKATLTIENGAEVGAIVYNGVTYTQAEWMART